MENNSIASVEQTDKTRGVEFTQSLWAYTLLSWLTGTVPAILLVPKVFRDGPDETTTRIVQLIVIGLCSFGGLASGLFIGLLMGLARRKEPLLLTVLAPLFGGIWGIVVGGLGGFPIFFIGGIILGWMFAVPLGILSFSLFALVYESLIVYHRLRWRHVVLIEIGVLILSLIGGYYLVQLNSPY